MVAFGLNTEEQSSKKKSSGARKGAALSVTAVWPHSRNATQGLGDIAPSCASSGPCTGGWYSPGVLEMANPSLPAKGRYLCPLPWAGGGDSLSRALRYHYVPCKVHTAAEAPSAVGIRIPVASQSSGQEQARHFVPDFMHRLGTALQREEGEATETGKIPFPRSLKERTVQVFYFRTDILSVSSFLLL